MGQERRGHARAALVEELLERPVAADDRDQAGAAAVGDQQRDVLAGAGGGQRHRVEAERPDPRHAGGAPVGIGVHDQLGAGLQGLVGDRVHVADDHVRPVADVHQRVRAGVDRQQHRPVLADIGPQRPQVLAVAEAADDDEHVPAVHVGRQRRHVVDAVGEQAVLSAQELQGVGGERVDLARHPGGRLVHRLVEGFLGLQHALGDDRVALVEDVAVEPHQGAVGDPAQHLAADVVDQRDARLEQQPGAEVGVPAGDRPGGVDDGRGTGGDQLVGRHAVQVGVVDHGDVAGREALDQNLGPQVHPGHADEAGRRIDLTPPDVRKLNGWHSHRSSSWHTCGPGTRWHAGLRCNP